MSNSLIATLSVNLACQLICAGNRSAENFPLDIPVPKHTKVIPDDYTQFPDIGVAYKFYNTSLLAWNSARKACIVHGGNLAVIDSFEKVNYVHGLTANPHSYHVLVGIHRLYGNGEWVSVNTGLPMVAIPWGPTTNEETQGNDCLASGIEGTGLLAVSCGEKRHFVCEISLE